MSGVDLLKQTISSRLPEADIKIEYDPDGYHIEVVAPSFIGKERADREGIVYSTFGRLPLSLLAKIKTIVARDPTHADRS